MISDYHDLSRCLVSIHVIFIDSLSLCHSTFDMFIYIYFDIIHPCIYLSSALASRPELTEEDALALPASVAQVGNVSLEIQEIRTIGIQFWESVDLTKTCSFSMQLFYKLLL